MDLNFGPPGAVAHVRGESIQSGPIGTVSFYPAEENTLVVADIHRLPHSDAPCSSNIFAFHIHEGGSCAGVGFPETKAHFNPENCLHPYHAGDLPPLFENNGRAFMAVMTNRFTIPDIIGRTVVIHSHPDDFTTQLTGNPGTKIACGVIRLS